MGCWLTILLVWLACLGSSSAWETTASFEDYPAGSDASPSWETTTIGWEVHGGKYIASDAAKSFALPQAAPAGRRVVVETTVTVEASLEADWKIAGVVVAQSPENYWHLALVESPADRGRTHFVELVESLDGQWHGQAAEGTRLTMTESVHPDFPWEHGRPYRLRLELTPEGVRGAVSELDGTEQARLAYRFDGRAVTSGRPGLDNGGFRTAFDDVQMRVADPLPPPSPRPPPPPCTIAGDSRRRGEATGFFHVTQDGGRWWWVTPEGRPFYVLGVDHVSYRAHWCEQLGYAPYHRVVAGRYGSETAWGKEARRRLQAWGFNSLTAGHSESLRHQGLAHTEFLQMGTGFAAIHPLAPRVHWTGFPNVFHPKFVAYCDKLARQRCTPHRSDPWLLGYFLDNELEWFGKPPHGHLLDWAMSRPASDPAKQALVGLLRERHGSAGQFNQAWRTGIAGFDDLAALTNLPPATTAAAQQDRDEFVRRLADRYFAVTTAAIRKHDPNHLILGCRFAGTAPSNLWAVAGRYCDIVSVNVYPRLDLETGAVPGVEEYLREAHARSKRPLMITEWSFPALDAADSEGRPLPCRHGAGMRVDTQAQKARACEVFQRLLFRLPFVVGSDYFMWADEPALGISSTFPEDSNYGLVSESDEPYEVLTGMFARLNPQVYRVHAGDQPVTAVPGEAPPPQAAAQLAGTVRVERDGPRLVVENGLLRLVKEEPDGDAWDRIELGKAVLGRFTPLLHLWADRNLWVAPDRVTSISVSNAEPRTVIEMVFEKDAAWQAAYRFTIYPEQNWFLSQLLWLENRGAEPLHCVQYYHYAPSFIGGLVEGDVVGGVGVPNYYLPFAAWKDASAGQQYGVVALHDQDFQVHFWADQYGQHPDASRKLDLVVKPGDRYAESQPAIGVFGASIDEHPGTLARRLRAIVQTEIPAPP